MITLAAGTRLRGFVAVTIAPCRLGLALAALAVAAGAEDWPQWRDRAATTSRAKSVPTTWGRDRGRCWSVDLPGQGTPRPSWAERAFSSPPPSDRARAGAPAASRGHRPAPLERTVARSRTWRACTRRTATSPRRRDRPLALAHTASQRRLLETSLPFPPPPEAGRSRSRWERRHAGDRSRGRRVVWKAPGPRATAWPASPTARPRVRERRLPGPAQPRLPPRRCGRPGPGLGRAAGGRRTSPRRSSTAGSSTR